MGQVIDLDSRRKYAAKKKVHERIDEREIEREMKKNSQTTSFGGSHRVRLEGLPRSVREVKRFLATLSEHEQLKAERIVEDITLDARVGDRSFACTLVYLRSNKDPEILEIYKKIRTAIFTNLGIMLPEFSPKELPPSS